MDVNRVWLPSARNIPALQALLLKLLLELKACKRSTFTSLNMLRKLEARFFSETWAQRKLFG